MPLNRGLSALRFMVSDLSAVQAAVQARGVPITTPPARMTIAPCGETRMMAITSPEGARLEIFEPLR